MENIKKLYCFIVIAIWILSTIGSVGYLLYIKEYLFSIANICTSAMAFPYIKESFNNLIK